jgi:hypothetical protein
MDTHREAYVDIEGASIMKWLYTLTALGLLAALGSGCTAAEPPQLPHRWLFVMRSMTQPENLPRTIELLSRAQAAGYNGLVLSDNRFWIKSMAAPGHAEALRKLQTAAKSYGLDLIPCVMPIGYSGRVVGTDPNLAEGLPVKDALFTVHDRVASLTPDRTISFAGGDFEQTEGDLFRGWDSQDNVGKSIFADHGVVHAGKTAVRMERIAEGDPEHGHCRLSVTLKVQPFRQYRLRGWVKTQGFARPSRARLLVIAPTETERDLAEIRVTQETQDWTLLDTTFNALQWSEVQLYVGSWGGGEGKLWWDDISVDEVGLVDVLRRDGCPLSVKSEMGTGYVEGQDFAPVRDPRLAPWEKGYHDPPTIELTPTSRLKEGERLRVSYYHSVLVGNYSVMCCISEPKVYELLAEQIRWVNEVLHPAHFFMLHDEIRTMNWDAACQHRRLTPGQLLADNARKCVDLIKQVRPDAKIWVWSDMFCPQENAVDEYYLVNGTLKGSWEGLGAEIGIANWANDLQGKNLKWFADRGHRQVLCGYYDGSGYPIDKWLAAGKGLPGIVGAMYTTWEDNYADMDSWAKTAWGGGPEPAQEAGN